MDTKKILKMAGLNIGIALLNIILFAKPLLGNKTNGSDVLWTAIGVTSIIMSIIVFVYGNYKLISQKGRTIETGDIKTSEDCTLALKQAYGNKTFDEDISTMLDQVERLVKKKEKIRNVLLQKYNVIDAAYERFNGSITDVEFVFYTNIKSILNRIYAFDEEDYLKNKNAMGRNLSSKLVTSKMSIYNEYISFVKNAMYDNEKIILKLDALLLEISKIDTLEVGEIDNMKEMKEMDELIKKSKFYQ